MPHPDTNAMCSEEEIVMFKNGVCPVHPGEILREEFLLPLAMSVNALAKTLQIPTPSLTDVVLERRGITADIATRLARCFNTSPQFWMSLQAEYETRLEQLKRKC